MTPVWAPATRRMNSPRVPASLTLHTASPAATQRIGVVIGRAVVAGQVIALCGDLGAGKTTLVQGIAAGMGVQARVTSPTFILVNEYAAENGCRLVHIDAYRLAEGVPLADAATFGLADLLTETGMDGVNVVAIEWADRVAALLPADILTITISASEDDPDARTFQLTATGAQSAAIVEQLRISGVVANLCGSADTPAKTQ